MAIESFGPSPPEPLLTQRHLEVIFNATHDVVMVIDGESHDILHVNDTVLRVLGYSPDKLIGTPFSRLLPDGEFDLLQEAELVDGVYGPLRFLRSDGQPRMTDVTVAVIPWDGHPAFLYSLRDATQRTQMELERNRLISELKEALARVKQLSGLLPICARCKRIRDDGGYWSTVEQYISAHSEAEFSHGICPECRDILYPHLGKGG